MKTGARIVGLMGLALIGVLPQACEKMESASAPHAEVFVSGVTYDQAVAKAGVEKRILIVDSMADWCGPCKMMDREVWPDAEVVSWVKANAVAFQFDVDKSPELARQFKIDAMPTVMVMYEGKEIGRHVGFMPAPELLGWLKSVTPG